MKGKVYYFPHLDGTRDFMVFTTSIKKCAELIGFASVNFLTNNRAILTENTPSHNLAIANPGTVFRRLNSYTRDVKPWEVYRVAEVKA